MTLVGDSSDGVDFVARESSSQNKPQLVVTTEQAAGPSAPEATIDSGPAASTASTDASFAFSADQADASFQCRLDGAAFEACDSPTHYAGLGEGQHSFEVRAIGADGAPDATPASRNWTVDTTPAAAPMGLTATAGAGSISLDWEDNLEPDLAGYRVYRQDSDGTWPATPLAATIASSHLDNGLTEATAYTYRVTAHDSAGNGSGPSSTAGATPLAPPASSVVMAAGDFTSCSGSSCATSNAAKVRDAMQNENPDVVLGLGDHQYSYGPLSALLSGFDTIFGPKPGGLWPLFRPTAGSSHDVSSGTHTGNDSAYWGRDPFTPYSFDLGNWHIVQLPGVAYSYGVNTSEIPSWLNSDLSASGKPCMMAFWHHPYWTMPTSQHSRTTRVKPWIDALYNHGGRARAEFPSARLPALRAAGPVGRPRPVARHPPGAGGIRAPAVVGVSASMRQATLELLALIREIHSESEGSYGWVPSRTARHRGSLQRRELCATPSVQTSV